LLSRGGDFSKCTTELDALAGKKDWSHLAGVGEGPGMWGLYCQKYMHLLEMTYIHIILLGDWVT